MVNEAKPLKTWKGKKIYGVEVECLVYRRGSQVGLEINA